MLHPRSRCSCSCHCTKIIASPVTDGDINDLFGIPTDQQMADHIDNLEGLSNSIDAEDLAWLRLQVAREVEFLLHGLGFEQVAKAHRQLVRPALRQE